MTRPTFQELLTSQDARNRAKLFGHDPDKCSHWMSPSGLIYPSGHNPACVHAIWQGWLTDCAPPPDPRVFKFAGYYNVFEGRGIDYGGWCSRGKADFAAINSTSERLACVRVEITAIEGQYDD